MSRKRTTFLGRMRNRILGAIVIGVIILLAVLYLRCNGGWGFGNGLGVGTGNGNGNGNSSSNTTISSNNPSNTEGQGGSLKHRFFVLRFVEDPQVPDDYRTCYAVLHLPDGTTLPIEGKADTGEPSLTRYFDQLESTLKRVRELPHFASVDTIYIEDFTNSKGEPIFNPDFRTQHKSRIEMIFGAKVQWADSRQVNELLNKR
ncbi:MAG: hypothetical protein AB7K09_10955 [Planctomycetota bacterium]